MIVVCGLPLDDQILPVSAGPEDPNPGRWNHVESRSTVLRFHIDWIFPTFVLKADITKRSRSDERMTRTEVCP